MKKSLSIYINKYLEFRKSLGYSCSSTKYGLTNFNKFIKKKFPRYKHITREIIIEYLEANKHLASSTRASKIYRLRQFCRFLIQYEPQTYIPENRIIPSEKRQRKIYIFSEKEIIKLMQLTEDLKSTPNIRKYSYRTIIGLLWATGIRIGEALSLQVDDFDRKKQLIVINETKFYKSRIVPLSHSATQALSRYLRERNKFTHGCEVNLFFITEHGEPYLSDSVGRVFRKLNASAKIINPTEKYQRLHDIRHSFATRWLIELSKKQKDPYVDLPILATYLGHVDLKSTEIYLHPSIDILESAGKRLKNHYNNGETND